MPVRALHKSGFLDKPNWQPYHSISEISTEHTTKSKPEILGTYRHTYQNSPTGTATQRIEDTGRRTPKLTNTNTSSSSHTNTKTSKEPTLDIAGSDSDRIPRTLPTLSGTQRSPSESKTKISTN